MMNIRIPYPNLVESETENPKKSAVSEHSPLIYPDISLLVNF